MPVTGAIAAWARFIAAAGDNPWLVVPEPELVPPVLLDVLELLLPHPASASAATMQMAAAGRRDLFNIRFLSSLGETSLIASRIITISQKPNTMQNLNMHRTSLS